MVLHLQRLSSSVCASKEAEVAEAYLNEAIIKDGLLQIFGLLLRHVVLMHAPQVTAAHVGLQVDHYNCPHAVRDVQVPPFLVCPFPDLQVHISV